APSARARRAARPASSRPSAGISTIRCSNRARSSSCGECLADARRRYATVAGPSDCDDRTAALAQAVGRGLAEAGFTVVTGGEGGAMEHASQGAREAGGTVVGVLPGTDRARANVHADVTVVTGIGH